MQIQLSDTVALKLMTTGNITEGLEFSGFGFVEVKENTIYVYDVVVLDIGSEVFTEIDPKTLISLMERQDARNMKLWIHKHPCGDGVPGKHNWSGTDNTTITTAPLGGHPEMVKWSCSMVLTPRGWVGRIDNHLKNITHHIEVVPQCREAYVVCDAIQEKKPPRTQLFCGLPRGHEIWGQEYNEFVQVVKERFPESLLGDLGIPLEDMADFLVDSYYEGDDEMMDSFLDPGVTNHQILRMIKERSVESGSHAAH